MTYPIDDAATADAGMKAALRALTNTLDAPVTVSASGALSSTHYGKIVYADTASIALTLPTAPATNEVLRVFNGSAGNITVNGVTVGAGKDIIYVSIGSAWKRFEPQVTSAGGGGGISRTPWVAGRWYATAEGTVENGTNTVANRLHFVPFVLPFNAAADQLFFKIKFGVASTVGYGALYAGDLATLRPTGNALASSSASFPTTTTGTDTPTALNATVSFTANSLYFMAFSGTGAVALAVANAGSNNGQMVIGRPTASFSGAEWYYDGTAGTWPDMTALGGPVGAATFTPIMRAA